jgi:hypothetical protein
MPNRYPSQSRPRFRFAGHVTEQTLYSDANGFSINSYLDFHRSIFYLLLLFEYMFVFFAT